jgi:nicotinate-nucleotide adenylyltransferase
MRQGLPPVPPGRVIGLLGGSFDPPHRGHVHISREVLKRVGLDEVWWLVSPGNPLKAQGPADIARRMAACRAMARDRRIRVSDAEIRLGTRFTADTLAALSRAYPSVRFVWIMGADNLAQFHHWDRWQDILGQVPVVVTPRPGAGAKGGLSPAAQTFARWRLDTGNAGSLLHRPAPAWCLIGGPTVDISSTQIRNRGEWSR